MTVLEAITIMADKGVELWLFAEDEKLVGIFSERDYTRKVNFDGTFIKYNTSIRHYDI